VVELASDLGGGKTTFVQGLARALGYTGAVTSPTFTLSNIYALPDGREIHHYDLYRLGEAGVVGAELGEDIGEPTIITVIEWAGVAETRLPADHLTIRFEVTSDTGRKLIFSGSGPLSDKIVHQLSPEPPV